VYLPKSFAMPDTSMLHAFIREHPLAILVVHDAFGLAADHIPLMLTGSGDSLRLAGHVARANPLWQKAAQEDIDCLAIFNGAQHYISPNWYATKRATGKVVPTWNYEAVHVSGRLRAIDDKDWLRGILSALTDQQEASQATPWRMQDAPEDYLEKMLLAVVGIEIQIVDIIGKAKLSQNQPEENRHSLLEALHQAGDASSREMAQALQAACRTDQ
jgi:transcriptional regulator